MQRKLCAWMQIADRIGQIAASQSLEMAARAKAMKLSGIDVISMSLGEPDFDTPEHIRRAAQEAIDQGWSHYGPVAGVESLRSTIAAISRQPSAISYQAEDVVVSVGAKMAIYNAIQAAINAGDEVIIPMPSWVSYSQMVKLAGGVVVPVQTQYDDAYCMTAEQLRAALTQKTRMVILCSPNNPTGSVYTRAQLDALIDVLREWPNVIILSDEIYNALSYEGKALSMAEYAEIADRLVVINGVSKAYAMTGYRIGWMLCKDRAFVAACTRLQGQQLTCATMVAQAAAEAALRGPQDCVERMHEAFARRRELICRLAAEIPGWKFRKPQGAFYLFPDVSALGSGDEVAERLLEEAHVAVVSGSAFGCPECIRLSYAISEEEIANAMERIRLVIGKW